MDITAAWVLATNAMDEHNLTANGWKFAWANSKRIFGTCYSGRKLITLSRQMVQVNDESEVRDTILHEIAHALVGPGHMHDVFWKAMADAVGARPEACYTNDTTKQPEAPYMATCQDCGVVIKRYRRPTDRTMRGINGKCKYKTNEGSLVWRMRGLLMSPELPTSLPKPMWQREKAAHAPAQQPVSSELTQSDISDMMKRLEALENNLK